MTDTISHNDSPPSTATRKKRLIGIIAGVLVVILLAALTLVYWRGFRDLPTPANDAKPGASSANPAGSGQLTEFRNDKVGIALSYPASWAQLRSPDPQVLLVASEGQEGTFQLRAVDLPTEVSQEQLPAAKQLTDQIVGANKTAKMLAEPKQVQLGGLPGYWYLYTFKDGATGQEGGHSHFFIFKGKTMLSFVFEALPASRFGEAAPTFDQITSSFHVLNK
jgi:hypothetical protein